MMACSERTTSPRRSSTSRIPVRQPGFTEMMTDWVTAPVFSAVRTARSTLSAASAREVEVTRRATEQFSSHAQPLRDKSLSARALSAIEQARIIDRTVLSCLRVARVNRAIEAFTQICT